MKYLSLLALAVTSLAAIAEKMPVVTCAFEGVVVKAGAALSLRVESVQPQEPWRESDCGVLPKQSYTATTAEPLLAKSLKSGDRVRGLSVYDGTESCEPETDGAQPTTPKPALTIERKL
jgi:hypothetical protein